MGGPGFGAYEPVAGVSVGWDPGTAPWAREVTTDSDFARVIAEARGTGATGIKMYRYLSPEMAASLATEAHRQGMRVWSHTRIRGHTGTGEPSSQPGEVVVQARTCSRTPTTSHVR